MTPEEIAQHYELPLQRALIDFDPYQTVKQVIGGGPMDLSDISMEPVKTLVAPWAIITIMAHEGDGQMIADMLASPLVNVTGMVRDYAEDYFKNGVMDFSLNALSNEQIRNVERNTGVHFPVEDDN